MNSMAGISHSHSHFGLTRNEIRQWRELPAEQQPQWEDVELLEQIQEELASAPALVDDSSVFELRSILSCVAAGELQVIQSGDCAENPAEATSGHVTRKAGLLDALAGAMKLGSHQSVVRVGRIAGQFGKPRSKPTEWVDGKELPVFRGSMVNGVEADAQARRPDPKRLLSGYHAAADTLDALRGAMGFDARVDAPVWTSHEALLLDYELPMVRQAGDGRWFLGSTHWPWIGDRTRDVSGAHVELLAKVANPVACKVGPKTSVDELLALCERLDPERMPGRLTLIARMGSSRVREVLPDLVSAVRDAGHPVIWLCDPMHGNTVTAPSGHKTRVMEAILAEVEDFHQVVTSGGAVAGGLHLEATPDHVTECVTNDRAMDLVPERYTTLCDPRLNPNQAFSVAYAWRDET